MKPRVLLNLIFGRASRASAAAAVFRNVTNVVKYVRARLIWIIPIISYDFAPFLSYTFDQIVARNENR